MSVRLRELITAVRNARTAQEEREVISKEAAEIRTFFSKDGPDDAYYRPRNVAKLLFMNMLGYPTHWGQLECLKLIVSHDYVDKRIGYLALNILLDENTEVLMLATQAIKNDVMSQNHYIAGLALTTFGNIASEQICRDVAPEIEQLCESDDPYVRKKAILCALKIARKVPDLVEPYLNKLKGMISDRDHGVLITAIAFISFIAKDHLEFIRQKLTKPLVALIKGIMGAGFNPEYDLGGINDPLLQVQILRLLRYVGQGHAAASEQMNDVLMQILSNTDSTRSVGHAILYEAINTALAIECEKELKLMAINFLGKFLGNKDNNIRYVGLTTLSKVIDLDAEAVQRHRAVVVECLKDPDLSIRKRALHLIYALVDESNARTLVRELLNFLHVADKELRGELTVKLCYVAEKYSPSSRWYIDSIMRVMAIAGDHVPDEIEANYIATVIRNPELQAYTAAKAFLALKEDASQNTLAQVKAYVRVLVALWCIGEYGDLLILQPSTEEHPTPSPDEVIALIVRVAHLVTSDNITREYALNALLKLSTRFPAGVTPALRAAIQTFIASGSVELQQRAIEYDVLFELDPSTRAQLLAKMPAAEVKITMPATLSGEKLTSSSGAPREASPDVQLPTPGPAPVNLLGDLLGTSTPGPTSAAAPSIANDLMGILGGVTPSLAPVSAPSGPVDILSLFGPSSTPAPSPFGLMPGADPSSIAAPFGGLNLGAPAAAPMPFGHPPADASGIPSMVAFQNGELSVTFSFKKPNPQQPQFSLITATAVNASPALISDFSFLAAPPRHVKFILDAPTATSIPPGAASIIMIKAANSNFGEKPLSMKMRIGYAINGQRREIEEVTKSPFPAGL